MTQQLSGINGILQYLPTILKETQTNVQVGTSIVNFVNFITVFFTGFFLKKYGRRTLMIVFPACIVVVHVVIAACLWTKPLATDYATNYIALLMFVLFVAFFEFSMGPILWLYNAEILNNKAVTVAVAVNWIGVLIISYFTPTLLNKL